jgi:isopentenyl-diphosphate delta-isomerase
LKDPRRAAIAAAFRDWGIPTAEAIRQAHQTVPNTPIFASGGLRSGVDAAKVLALGASLAGIAGPFLKAASRSHEASSALADDIISELRICMFAGGAANLSALREIQLVEFTG